MRRSLPQIAVACALLAMWAGSASPAIAKSKHRPKPQVTVPSTLQSLLKRDRITQAQYSVYLREWVGDLREENSLKGWRKQQLAAVTALLHEIAQTKQMTAPRLPVLFETLQRNAQYWKAGAKLVYADRVEFPGSLLEWEYYPGYGLQLQVLGTFGEANGFYEAGKADYPQLVQVLDEMEALAVPRAGGIAWEYYFDWEGGTPGWVSAMAQATGIEALTNGYLATGDSAYLSEAHAALPLLETPPPVGVEVTTPLGARFLQYSFAPKTDIINAFLQTLIGLYDYQQVSHDPTALSLFDLGNAQAQSELSGFVVGGWSLYQPGQLDNLNYHELVTGFAQSLCKKLSVAVYCSTASTFAADLSSRPTIFQNTVQTDSGRRFPFEFTISKAGYVGVTISSGDKRYLYTRSLFRSGTRSFKTPKLKPGAYSVALAVTDMAGHYQRISGTLQVCNACTPVTAPTPVTTTTTTSTTPPPTTTTPTNTTTSTTSTTTTTTSGSGGNGL